MRTTEKKVNFLQRLEAQDKFKAEEHSNMKMEKKVKLDEVKYRQEIENKKIDKKRRWLDKKDERQASQVKLAHERSQSQIEIMAEKRNLIKEQNVENNSRIKNTKFDINMSKLYKHEMKKQQRGDFAQALVAASNVTSKRAVSELM